MQRWFLGGMLQLKELFLMYHQDNSTGGGGQRREDDMELEVFIIYSRLQRLVLPPSVWTNLWATIIPAATAVEEREGN